MRNNGNQKANLMYKVRISKGFVDADFGEGFLVEVWDFRTQRLVYGERYKELERARSRQREIKNDLDNINVDRFKQVYMSRVQREERKSS
ncbi:MAG: hypothetical protein A2W01_07425 [Candidatus Solincola sediminis]|uniref:Uncharacterized protein n=1 Tax=Candidatus Solincola sediminis TaxID=1797199 RepID=A0A1F2WJ10_9ACTN|nr:MAG: hypothetical protein A2Y75_06575 [Candidatus Solincola sediminis]OFW61071.1 MAG: hypothetical protein A2W01_07425 [Candidatus Solincola sediminis]